MSSQLDEDEERYQNMLRKDREDNDNLNEDEYVEENGADSGQEEEGTLQQGQEEPEEGQDNRNEDEEEEDEDETDDPILMFNRESQQERSRIVNEQLKNTRTRRHQLNQESRNVQQEAVAPIRKVYYHTQREMKRGKWTFHGFNNVNVPISTAIIKQHKGYSKTLFRQRFDDSQAQKRNRFYHEKKQKLFQLVSR